MNKFQDLTPAPGREPIAQPSLETASRKQPAKTANVSKPAHLLSIDALRGFDMLMITGAGTLLVSLENKTGWSWVDAIGMGFPLFSVPE